jgi:hypothetical protein
MNPINFFGTPLYIGDCSLYDIMKICILNPGILFHELSHYFAAKLCGFTVHEINVQHTHGHVKHSLNLNNDYGEAFVTVSGHVGQTIIFNSIIPTLSFIFSRSNEFCKFICFVMNFRICVCNTCAFLRCFDWLLYPKSDYDFTKLMNNKCYITIGIGKIIIGYCTCYSIKNALKFVKKIVNPKIDLCENIVVA